MSLVDVHTYEEHHLYVNRWLAADEDDHQIVRELALRRSPAADTLPGMIICLLSFALIKQQSKTVWNSFHYITMLLIFKNIVMYLLYLSVYLPSS